MPATSDQNTVVPARSRSFDARDRGCVSVADTSYSPKGSNPVRSMTVNPSNSEWNVVVSAPNGNGSDWRFWPSTGKLLPSDEPETTVFFFGPVWRSGTRLQR